MCKKVTHLVQWTPDGSLFSFRNMLMHLFIIAQHMSEEWNFELATQDGGSLHALAHTARKLIQPGHQYGADISRQKIFIQGLDQSPASLVHFNEVFFLEITDDLFNKIRVTFGTFHHK